MNLPAPEVRDRRFCTALFAVVLGLNVWCSHLGWTNVPVDGHEFRQTQTAISIRYLAQDGLRLDYPTPLLGKPWSIPLEFPLYQNAAALLVRLTGLPVEQAARTISLAFFYLSLPALYLLAGRLSLPPHRRLLVLACVLASPVYLFYQRTVLIESTALCLGVWFLHFYWTAQGGSFAATIAALACGALAAMVKATTFCIFLAPALFILVAEVVRRRASLGSLLLRAALLMGGGLIAAAGWAAYADSVKRLNPLSHELQSNVASHWITGDLSLRFSPSYWSAVGVITSDSVLGWIGLIGLALFVLLVPGATRRTIGLLLLCYLAPLLVFSNVYLIHDYYFFANGVFLLTALSLAVNHMLNLHGWPSWTGWSLLVLTLGTSFFTYSRSYYRLIPANETRVPELSRALRAVTRPDDVLVIIGQDWNPVLPYTAERRALMLPFPLENNRDALTAALTLLRQDTVGALVATGPQRYRADLLRPVIRQFGLSSSPVLAGDVTDVYLPSAKQGAAVPVLAGLNLHQHHIDTRGQRIVVAEMPAGSASFFTMMTPEPREVAAQFGIGLNPLGDREVFGAHPSSELVFPTPPGARRLRAGFGLLPGAYADSAKHTDGVLFEVLLQTREGQLQLLAERLLTPATRETDRGTQKFDLELPAGTIGDLILRTGPGPANDLAFDWAYWSFVTIK